jgi:hypothetical protein
MNCSFCFRCLIWLPGALSGCLLAGALSAQELPTVSDAGATQASPQTQASRQPQRQSEKQLARGLVFEDLNGNGVRDVGEPGLPGVRVSNGSQIVTTDDSGRYELSVDDDTILFVIKPRNYMTPVDEHNLPKFYYIHKPEGSPANFRFAGVAPTGPLPKSVDFALYRRPEPDQFRALFFGDTQPRNVSEVEYMAHDVIQQLIANKGHQASFGVTLGDIVFDDLDVMQPHNEVVALVGIPWYNVLGNHDMNFDAVDDRHSDETFERIYGPSYYSFDHGPAHFIVVDNVVWVSAQNGEKAHYYGGLGPEQMQFIRNDLEGIPEDQLVVLMMHIPLTDVRDRHELYRLIEQRPAAISLSAHRHFMEHRYIGPEDDWRGSEKHHHIVNVTVCGSWWTGKMDERGIPHATMSDGGPNGYSILEFNGNQYSFEFYPASRSADYQMNIYAPNSVTIDELAKTSVLANVFAGCEKTVCKFRVGSDSAWLPMEATRQLDPAFVAESQRDAALPEDRPWRNLPKPYETPHIWKGSLPATLPVGTHVIEVEATMASGKKHVSQRVIRVVQQAAAEPVLDAAG